MKFGGIRERFKTDEELVKEEKHEKEMREEQEKEERLDKIQKEIFEEAKRKWEL